MENNKFKKIYVYCPRVVTGGPETHHNVVSTINNNGGDAYIFYNDKKEEILKEYSNYNVKVATEIDDNSDNLLIVSEIATDLLFKYKHINKAIMFLSLQYYHEFNIRHYISIWLKKKKLPKILYPFIFIYCFIFRNTLNRKFNFKKVDFKDEKLIITCNGYINKEYLVNKLGISSDRIGYVCGPLNGEFLTLNSTEKKENIVAYNPKKGWDFTQRIISLYNSTYNDIKFLPIENMTAKEVHSLLLKSKVYIDFGNHPGPERIPREAVISGCNIITSINGSAGNQIDVPIPVEFKFACIDDNAKPICELIHDMIFNYDQYISYFNDFKNKVLNQPKEFENNVLKYFLYNKR